MTNQEMGQRSESSKGFKPKSFAEKMRRWMTESFSGCDCWQMMNEMADCCAETEKPDSAATCSGKQSSRK